jgi:hypothetical protein
MTSSMPSCCSRRRSVENCRPAVPSMPVTRLQAARQGESQTHPEKPNCYSQKGLLRCDVPDETTLKQLCWPDCVQ